MSDKKADLKRKLSYLRKKAMSKKQEPGEEPPDQDAAGKDHSFDLQALTKRNRRRAEEKKALHPGEGWHRIDEFVFTKTTTEPNPFEEAPLALFGAEYSRWGAEDLLFFDVETTGLSGGAGNLIFLIGMGRLRGERMEIEQVFLSDFPGEPSFLNYLIHRLPRERLYVSYNGRGFDAHVIRTRFLMNGMDIEFPHHLDLLYLSRRLWKKNLESCSLGNIESHILDVSRSGDIPGFLVPHVYFSFLKTGRTGDLRKVFYHNLVDIHSLGKLLNRQTSTLSGKGEMRLVDRAALGEYLLVADPPRGKEILAGSFAEGNGKSGKILSLYYKKQGCIEDALPLWEEMFRREKSHFAATELAKYYEHKVREYRTALEWVEKCVNAGLSREEVTEVSKRKMRLLKKIERSERS